MATLTRTRRVSLVDYFTDTMPKAKKSPAATPKGGKGVQAGAGSASDTPRSARRAKANSDRAARANARGKAADSEAAMRNSRLEDEVEDATHRTGRALGPKCRPQQR